MIYVINYKLNQLDFSANIGYRLDNKVIAYKTEKTSAYWVKRFIYFNNKTYPKNLGIVIDDLSFSPAKVPRRLPVVYTQQEIAATLSFLSGTPRLMVELDISVRGRTQPAL